MTAAIILAAGRGERMGAKMDKAFISLGSKPIVAYSLLAFQACPDIDSIVLVVREDRIASSRELCRELGVSKLAAVITGGADRQDSVSAGIAALPHETDVIAVHDSARPLVTPELISATIRSAEQFGSGVAAHKVVDTIKSVEKDNVVAATVDRAKLWTVATPQTFSAAVLRRAYGEVAARKATVTDDAGALELIGEPVRLVAWPHPNFKITVAEDLDLARKLLCL